MEREERTMIEVNFVFWAVIMGGVAGCSFTIGFIFGRARSKNKRG